MPRIGFQWSKDLLIKHLAMYQTAQKIAIALGAHPQTVRKYLREYGIQTKRGPKSRSKRINSAKFGQWLRGYTGGSLPNSITELSEISGVSKNAVRNYLWRNRRKTKLYLSSVPWNKTEIVVWKDIKGQRIPDVAFDVVRSYVGQSGIIKFHVRLMDKSVHVFRYTLKELKDLYEEKGAS